MQYYDEELAKKIRGGDAMVQNTLEFIKEYAKREEERIREKEKTTGKSDKDVRKT